MRFRTLALAVVCVPAAVISSSAQVSHTQVGFGYNSNILNYGGSGEGTAYGPALGGPLTVNGITFNLPGAGNRGLNAWTSANVGTDFQPYGGNPRTLDIAVNIFNATTVHTLMNTFWGQSGVSLVFLEFLGTGGAYQRRDLFGNVDIRDYITTYFTSTIGGSTVNAFTGTGSGARLDMQTTDLNGSFANQTLQTIRVTDIGDGGVSRAFLAGVNVDAPVTATPEPATWALLGTGLAGMAVLRRRRRAMPATHQPD